MTLFFRRCYSTSGIAAKLADKVAIVTASSDGIGFAIARQLAKDGAKVVISSRKSDKVKAAVEKLKLEQLNVYGTVCHVGKAEDRKRLVEETVKQFGGIDILVSNAGTNPTYGPIFDTTEKVWDKIFDTNVKSAFFMCKETVPHISKRGGGSIVLVSSIAAYTFLDGLGTYCVSKTALVGLCKALTAQCASMNIRVNCLAPGIIKTKFSEALIGQPSAEKAMLRVIPQKRLGEPEDCATVASFLASSDSQYITGETIVVSGGMPSRL